MTIAYQLRPWTSVVTVHDDIESGHLDLSTYAANLWAVHNQESGCPAVYKDPMAFFEATYMTTALKDLLQEVLGVLTGKPGDRVLQLRTPFGGGKTHALIALYHAAGSRGKLGRSLESQGFPDPSPVKVVVLHGVAMDPTVGRKVEDDTILRTLWGELAWQIGGRESYEFVRAHDESGSAPGGDIVKRILEQGTVLLLLDEVLVYVEKAMAVPLRDSTAGRQALIFLQTLTEVVRGLPHAAMVYALQASAHEALGSEGLLSTLDKLVSRIDAKREPVTGDEVMQVVQRRLFKDLGEPAVRKTVVQEYAALYRKFREGGEETERARRDVEQQAEALKERILLSYPFHPDLLDLMYHRWGSLPSYQRTRGALQFLACTVAAIRENPKGALPLIGPGDVPLADDRVRGALFSQVGEKEHYTSVLEGDITGSRGRAREVDRRFGRENAALEPLRVGTRVATSAFLYSFGTRKGEERGIPEEELLAAGLAPALDRVVLAATLADLKETLLHLHHVSGHYRFDTEPNLNKLVAVECSQWRAEEVEERIKEDLWSRLKSVTGPVLWPPGHQQVPDGEYEFKVAYLDLGWAGKDESAADAELRQWTENKGGGKRAHRNGIAFAIPDRRQAEIARNAARTLMGVESLHAKRAKLQLSPDQVDDLRGREATAKTELDAALRRLYGSLRLPVADKQAPSGYRLEPVEIHSLTAPGRDVHAQVMEALRQWVSDTVTYQKLLALARLGVASGEDAPGDFIACDQLLDWFYSYLDFPKIRDGLALQRAVAAGIEKRALGYTPNARVAEGRLGVDNPDLVQFAVKVDPADLDLSAGAFIMTPALAERVGPSRVTPPSEPGANKGEGGVGAGQAGEEGGAGTATPAGAAEEYWLRVEAEGPDVFKVMEVLQYVSDKARRLKVVFDVTAESKEGFDPVWLRNTVEEPLDEANVKRESRIRK